MRTVTLPAYKFDELVEDIQELVIENEIKHLIKNGYDVECSVFKKKCVRCLLSTQGFKNIKPIDNLNFSYNLKQEAKKIILLKALNNLDITVTNHLEIDEIVKSIELDTITSYLPNGNARIMYFLNLNHYLNEDDIISQEMTVLLNKHYEDCRNVIKKMYDKFNIDKETCLRYEAIKNIQTRNNNYVVGVGQNYLEVCFTDD